VLNTAHYTAKKQLQEELEAISSATDLLQDASVGQHIEQLDPNQSHDRRYQSCNLVLLQGPRYCRQPVQGCWQRCMAQPWMLLHACLLLQRAVMVYM
jgi:hypothetical protein